MYNDIVEIYDQIFPLNQAFLDFIPAYLGTPGSRVLDLGCGPGYYVDELARRGFRVTGIDSSVEMIRQAKERFFGDFYPYSFTEISQLENSFDCIYCIGNSLSYLPLDLMPTFCRDVNHLLNKGGYFLLQVVNWDKYRLVGASDFPVKSLADGRTFHRRYTPLEGEGVLFETELRQGDKLLQSWSDTLYPKYAVELKSLVENAGMTVNDLIGDYAQSPFDLQNSPATILIAQKKELSI